MYYTSTHVVPPLRWGGSGRGGADTTLTRNARDRRRVASRLRGVGDNTQRSCGGIDDLGLDKYRDNLARLQTEFSVIQHTQEASNLTRVTADADPRVSIIRKDVIEDDLVA